MLSFVFLTRLKTTISKNKAANLIKKEELSVFMVARDPQRIVVGGP